MGAISSNGVAITMGATAVGLVTDFQVGGTAAEIDITHLGSTGREYMAGIPDGGTCTFTIHYDPDLAGHVALTTAYTARTSQAWVIELTNNDDMTFSGPITGLQFEGSIDSPVSASVTVRVSGAITFPAAVDI
jgi:predicted secreted protein